MNTLLSLTAIILVSFGTSYENSRQATIVAVEKEVQQAYPDAYVTSAYTSTMIRKKLLERDGTKIFSVSEALEDAKAKGCKTVLIQPTHMMYGLEYNEMKDLAAPYEKQFDKVLYGEPLMATNEDISAVLKALAKGNPLAKKQALVLMGHGSPNQHNPVYELIQRYADDKHLPVHIGVVEAEDYPNIDDVIRRLKKDNIKKVFLRPMMLVGGDHAQNDMAGESSDSWKNRLKAAGIDVRCCTKGLGENPAYRKLYVEKLKQVI